MKITWIVQFLCLIGITLDPTRVAAAHNFEKTEWLVSSIRHAESKSFYGTGLLFRAPDGATDDSYYFVTNAHVIPASEIDKTKLLVASPLWRYEWRSAKVLGVAPGFDLAVFIVGRNTKDVSSIGLTEFINSLYWSNSSYPNVGRFGVLGIPGLPQYFDEARPAILTEIADQQNIESAEQPKELSVETKLKTLSECPAAMIPTCFSLPMIAWGFSGGALVTKTGDEPSPLTYKILGMVSHFSPLSAQTFVIPWNEASIAIDEIVKKSKEGVSVVEKLITSFGLSSPSADSLTFEFENRKLQASATKDSHPGGSEHMGGGGDGGFGSLSSGDKKGAFFRSKSDSIGYFGNFSSLINESMNPGKWGNPTNSFTDLLSMSPSLRAGNTFLNYRPGIAIQENGQWLQFFTTIDGTPLNSLGSLAKILRNDPLATFSQTFPKKDYPQNLKLQFPHMGIMSMSRVAKFRPGAEIKDLLNSGKLNMNDTGFDSREEFQKILKTHADMPAGSDLIIGKGYPFPTVGLVKAELLGGDTHTSLQATNIQGERINFTFNTLIQNGPKNYRSVGPAKIEWKSQTMFKSGHWSENSNCVLTLSMENSSSSWELKGICTNYGDTSDDPRIGCLAPGHLNVIGFSVLLHSN